MTTIDALHNLLAAERHYAAHASLDGAAEELAMHKANIAALEAAIEAMAAVDVLHEQLGEQIEASKRVEAAQAKKREKWLAERERADKGLAAFAATTNSLRAENAKLREALEEAEWALNGQCVVCDQIDPAERNSSEYAAEKYTDDMFGHTADCLIGHALGRNGK